MTILLQSFSAYKLAKTANLVTNQKTVLRILKVSDAAQGNHVSGKCYGRRCPLTLPRKNSVLLVASKVLLMLTSYLTERKQELQLAKTGSRSLFSVSQ